MLHQNQSSLGVDVEPIGAHRRGFTLAFEHRLHERTQSFGIIPNVNRVAAQIAEHQMTEASMPDRTFGKREAATEFFDTGVGGNQRIHSRIDS